VCSSLNSDEIARQALEVAKSMDKYKMNPTEIIKSLKIEKEKLNPVAQAMEKVDLDNSCLSLHTALNHPTQPLNLLNFGDIKNELELNLQDLEEEDKATLNSLIKD